LKLESGDMPAALALSIVLVLASLGVLLVVRLAER
jgi:ABC-type sulfate transport system permease component